MARNTLEAVFGAVGAGLTGYGMGERQKREEEERRRREAFDRAINLERLGYQAEDQERLGAQQQTQKAAALARTAPTGMPGFPGSAVGRALEAAAAQPPDIARGRRLTLDGQTFVQPFSESRAGIRGAEEMNVRARDERLAELQRVRDEARFKRDQQLQDERLRASTQRTAGAEAPSATAVRTRQNVAAAEAERFLDAAGGDVEQAIRLYTQNPPADLTQAQIPLRREDFQAAKSRRDSGVKPANASQDINWSQRLREELIK